MMFKKMVSGLLIAVFASMYAAPISAGVNNPSNLSEFLKTTEKVSAKYEYPSYKIAAASTGKVKLPAHTAIPMRCDETITTNNVVNGSTVKFSVLGDIKGENGKVVIASGTPVTAQISFAKSKDVIGKSGTVTVTDFHTEAVDGTYVPLSASVSANPDDKMVLSVVLSVLICPLFLLMKGEEAQVPVGTTKTAYTLTDIYINVSNNNL